MRTDDESVGQREDADERNAGHEDAIEWNESTKLRRAVLTPEIEARARQLREKPSSLDGMTCALLNALDDARKALARTSIEADELRSRDVDLYQREATATAIYPGHAGTGAGELRETRAYSSQEMARAYVALKMNGEAGEIAEEIGKSMRDDGGTITPERRERVILELGDVQWYVAAMCTELDTTLSEVMKRNLAKLADRKARGVLKGSGSSR